jgi:hypothetical protein
MVQTAKKRKCGAGKKPTYKKLTGSLTVSEAKARFTGVVAFKNKQAAMSVIQSSRREEESKKKKKKKKRKKGKKKKKEKKNFFERFSNFSVL